MELEQRPRPGSEYSSIIEDLLELAAQDRQDAVDAAITMLEDLIEHGLESRFAKKLKGLPIWELKTRSRGKAKGGTRVYFFVFKDKAYLVNAEVKEDDTPSAAKLLEVFNLWKKVTGEANAKD